MPPAPTISALYVPTDSPSLSPSMGSAADPRSRDGPCSHHTSPQIVSKPAAPLRPCRWQAGQLLLYGNTVADGPTSRDMSVATFAMWPSLLRHRRLLWFYGT